MDIVEEANLSKPNFEPGDLAWAKVKGHNWWPSLVCNDPVEKVYIKTPNNKTQCHVQFFDERRSRAWVHAKDIKPYKGSTDPDFQNSSGQYYSKKKTVIAAVALADNILNLPKGDRLKLEQPKSVDMSDSDITPGSVAEAGIRVKDDPDGEMEETGIGPSGDASRQTSSSPESVLTEMKVEPMEEGQVPAKTAVNIKQEDDADDEDYSEGEMETIAKEKEVEEAVKKKPGPKSAGTKPGPKSAGTKPGPKSAGTKPGPKSAGTRPGPKSKTKGAASGDATPSTSRDSSGTGKATYNVSDIPEHMKASFVKLSKGEVPPTVSPEKSVILPSGKGKSPKGGAAKKPRTPKATPAAKGGKTATPKSTPKGGKGKGKAAAKVAEVPVAGEDEGADESAGNRRKSKGKVTYKEDSDFEEMDFEDELIDSDEDPGWKPGKKKEGFTKGGKWKRGAPESDEEDLEEEDLEDEEESDFEEEELGGKKKKQPAKKKAKTVSFANQNKTSDREPVIEDDPNLFQPSVGDYLFEKSTVKDGIVPVIWLFKKGGIMQKFNRIVEDGDVLYEGAKFFSDWWDDYGDKYAVCKTQVRDKKQNKVRVAVTEWPEDIASLSNVVNGTTTEKPTSDNKENKSPEKTKETDVTSTTQGEEEFQIGRFVIDKQELRNIDNFSIWKIESGILLKKYEMHIVKGKMMHKPVKVYRGYRDIGEFYQAIKIKRVADLMSDYVEVDEASRPKLTYDERLEHEMEKNPLLEHFYVYLQCLLSQALEPEFLQGVYEKKEQTYINSISEIDKKIQQKMDQIEKKIRWNPPVKSALQKCPFLREVHKPVENSVCEAIQDTDETVQETIFLFGDEYDRENLKQEKGAEGSQEFKIGRTAAKTVSHYHQLCHFKFNLYDRCQAKVKLVQESKYGAPTVEETMDACLHNKAWVLQNFTNLLELMEKSTE